MKKRSVKPSAWQRHFFYRKESLRTTWKLRLVAVSLAALIVLVTRGYWSVRVAESLVCKEQVSQSDALLIENFDPTYLPFERAAALQRSGIASRIFVPVSASGDPDLPNTVSKGVTEVMARVAHIEKIELIPIEHDEPISWNAAEQIRDYLTQQHVKSIVVVTPDFRSRRSSLVYNEVLTPAGIKVGCVAAFGTKTPNNWTETTHGIQEVVLQFLKLQYYRLYVLPLF